MEQKVWWDDTRSDSGVGAQGPPLEGEFSTGPQHCGSWESLAVYGPFSDVTAQLSPLCLLRRDEHAQVCV